MIARWKTELRVWLVQLVRDAVRLELIAMRRTADAMPPVPHMVAPMGILPTQKMPKHQQANVQFNAITDPSFEQMQAEAIQAQEKFYGPAE